MLPLTLIALQAAATMTTTAPPDVWGIAGRSLTALFGLAGMAFLFTGRAIGRAWFCAMLTTCRPDLREAIDEIYEERMATVDEAVETVGVHTDQIEGLEASITAQGKVLGERLAENSEQQTSALREITRTLQLIQRDGTNTSSAVQRIEGFLDGVRAGQAGWSGADRRDPTR